MPSKQTTIGSKEEDPKLVAIELHLVTERSNVLDDGGRVFLQKAKSDWDDDKKHEGQRGDSPWNDRGEPGVAESVALLFACYRLWGLAQSKGSRFEFPDTETNKVGGLLKQKVDTDAWHHAVFGKGRVKFVYKKSRNGVVTLRAGLLPEHVTIWLDGQPFHPSADQAELHGRLVALVRQLGGAPHGASYAERYGKTYATSPGDSAEKNSRKIFEDDATLARYCDEWRSIYESAFASPPVEPQRTELIARWRRIRDLRLDKYIWPDLAWRRGWPAWRGTRTSGDEFDERDATDGLDDSWSDNPRGGIDSAWETLKQLSRDRLIVLYDNAGMGKSAFTHRLFDLLARAHEPANQSRGLASEGRPQLVVRLEGVWPRNERREPLSLVDLLVDELLGRRVSGVLTDDANPPDETRCEATRRLVQQLLEQDRVYLILDAFDQMSDDDRTVAVECMAKSRSASNAATRCLLARDRPRLCA